MLCNVIKPDAEALNKGVFIVFKSIEISFRVAFIRTSVAEKSLGGVLEIRELVAIFGTK